MTTPAQQKIVDEWASVLVRDLRLQMDSYRRSHRPACDVYHLPAEAWWAWAEAEVMPIYEEFDCPIPGQGRYLEYQDAVKFRLLLSPPTPPTTF